MVENWTSFGIGAVAVVVIGIVIACGATQLRALFKKLKDWGKGFSAAMRRGSK